MTSAPSVDYTSPGTQGRRLPQRRRHFSTPEIESSPMRCAQTPPRRRTIFGPQRRRPIATAHREFPRGSRDVREHVRFDAAQRPSAGRGPPLPTSPHHLDRSRAEGLDPAPRSTPGHLQGRPKPSPIVPVHRRCTRKTSRRPQSAARGPGRRFSAARRGPVAPRPSSRPRPQAPPPPRRPPAPTSLLRPQLHAPFIRGPRHRQATTRTDKEQDPRVPSRVWTPDLRIQMTLVLTGGSGP